MKNIKILLLCKYFLPLILIFAIQSHSKPSQYLALTGGTNGFGAKYSLNFIDRISVDAGLPFVYLFKERGVDDTTFETNEFQCNAYLSLNLVVFEKKRNRFSVGIAGTGNLKYELISFRFEDTDVKKEPEDTFFLNTYLSPLIEYTRVDTNNNKLFGVQLAPLKISHYPYKVIRINVGLQLNYYIKKF